MDISVNWVAILLATAISFLVGWLWYSPVLFGNIWMKEIGIKMPEKMTPQLKKEMMRSMLLSFLFGFVANTVLAHFLMSMNIYTASDVLELAFWLWLGFAFPVVLSGYLWEKKTLTLVAIGGGHTLVVLMVAGLIMHSMS